VSNNNQSFESRDGRLVIATAASMAMNLRMGQASVFVSGLRSELELNHSSNHAASSLTHPRRVELDDTVDKAKLWLALTTAESALCMGTSRTPLSKRSRHDLELVDLHILQGPTGDLRLGLLAQIFELMEEATQTQTVTNDTFEPWFRRIRATMGRFDELYRSVQALAGKFASSSYSNSHSN
jgi:hypothetical protein